MGRRLCKDPADQARAQNSGKKTCPVATQHACKFSPRSSNIAPTQGNSHDLIKGHDAAQFSRDRRGRRGRRSSSVSAAGNRTAREGPLHAVVAADRAICFHLLCASARIFQEARHRPRNLARLRLDGGHSGRRDRTIRDGWRPNRRQPAVDHEGARPAAFSVRKATMHLGHRRSGKGTDQDSERPRRQENRSFGGRRRHTIPAGLLPPGGRGLRARSRSSSSTARSWSRPPCPASSMPSS